MMMVRWAVNRPVAALMFYLCLCLFGCLCWFKIPRDLFPKISTPSVTVFTSFANASPEEVETMVSRVVEESLATVNGLKKVSSISREGLSMVTAEFSWNTKADFASLKVRQKIDLIKDRLPRDCGQPVIKKLNPFAMPAMMISVSGNLSDDYLLEFAEKTLKDELIRVEGVASVLLQGGRKQEVVVEVDPGLLRARNINLNLIPDSLKDTNINYPAGTTKEDYFEYLIRTEGEFTDIDQIGKTIISYASAEKQQEQQDNRIDIIRVEDIADISMQPENRMSISRFNGAPSLLLSIYTQSDANTVATAEKVHKSLKRIELTKPAGINISILYDKSVFIKQSIKGLTDSALQGGLLAFLVLWFFLQSIPAALIVAAAIPASILAALIFMLKSGMTLNMMSLGGLALGTGMLVDNAIVVMENVVRKSEQKNSQEKPAISGALEVWSAILASTLTTVAVFLPLVFLSGLAGQLFRDLALTVTFSLTASLFVSLTLIPRLARGFKESAKKRKKSIPSKLTDSVRKIYVALLKKFIKAPFIAVLALPVVLLLSFSILKTLPREIIPAVDEGQFIVAIDMPAGTKLSLTDQVVRPVEKYLLSEKDVKNVALTIGSNPDEQGSGNFLDTHQSRISIILKGKRALTTKQLIKKIGPDLKSLLPVSANLSFKVQGSNISKAAGKKQDINIELKSSDQSTLKNAAAMIFSYLKNNKALMNLHSTQAEALPETKIEIDKDKAAIMGISTRDISLTAKTALKGTVKTNYRDKEGREYPIRVKLKDDCINNIGQLETIPVWAGENTTVFLGDVAELNNSYGPSEILREDQEKIVKITADIQKQFKDQEELQKIRSYLRNISSEKLTISFNQTSEEDKSTAKEMLFTLILSIALVYMIMAAQFESIVKPLLIMVTVPLALIGVSLALLITQSTLNTVSVLGIVLLAGIVVNNGIVLIEYINQKIDEGEKISKAVIDAAGIRFRPILMTTLTTLLGLLPLAMGLGAGAELRSPMAVSVIGGLIASTVLTLFILPALFIFMNREKNDA